MPRESLIIRDEELVRFYESFGWELTGIADKRIALTRETHMSAYNELASNQKEYDALMKEYNSLYLKPVPTMNKFFICCFINLINYSWSYILF